MARNGSQGRASEVYPSDRIEVQQASPAALRWSAALTWFMRILALVWIMKGLGAWAVIIGVWAPIGDFEARSTGYQAIIIYFALIDLVAAVGLWMASSWGGIVWLLAIMSHLILAAFFPDIVAGGMPVMVLSLTLITVYLALSWLAAREL